MRSPTTRSVLALLIAAVTLTACAAGEGARGPEVVTPQPSATPTESASPVPGGAPLGEVTIDLAPVVTDGLEDPLFVTAAPGDAERLFVVEQGGRIRVVRDGALRPGAFADLSDRISTGGERGLLGLAFDPGFAESGVFYVNYTDRDGDTVVERLAADDPASDTPKVSGAGTVLTVRQPYANHNGGCIVMDEGGTLWVGMGDGGSGGDPENRAQDDGTLLGKLVAVNDARASAARPVVRAKGLRNPWRFSFDRATGDLWIGDVGQNAYEEIDFVAAGVLAKDGAPINFGWRLYEGTHPFDPSDPPAPKTGLTFPIVEYSHDVGNSVTGGYVYRGSAIPGLVGTYLYGDFGSGRIWGLARTDTDGEPLATPVNRELIDTELAIASFGEDAAGELYVVDLNGAVFRVVAGR